MSGSLHLHSTNCSIFLELLRGIVLIGDWYEINIIDSNEALFSKSFPGSQFGIVLNRNNISLRNHMYKLTPLKHIFTCVVCT